MQYPYANLAVLVRSTASNRAGGVTRWLLKSPSHASPTTNSLFTRTHDITDIETNRKAIEQRYFAAEGLLMPNFRCVKITVFVEWQNYHNSCAAPSQVTWKHGSIGV